MTERSLVLLTRELTPSGELSQPILTPGQQKDLSDITRIYARRVGIGLSIDTLKSISAVAGDAIFRALGEKGQSLPTPKDRLKPLFQRGLEIREDLRRKAKTFVDLSLRNQNTYQELVGPLAIPASLIRAANVEKRIFVLTADLAPIQQLVEMGEQRLSLVDSWANLGLAALPQMSKEVSLADFPTTAERVKIIRNMIASFTFRGNLSPLISIGELKDFVKKSPFLFGEEVKEQFLEQMQADTPGKRSYLEALYTQTREPFRLYTAVPTDDNPKEIENFYRRYTRDFLLMHPALEEQQIITNPQRVKEDILSIWDNPLTIAGFKLPRPDLLNQALRQAQARRDTLTVDGLIAGIRTWIWFEEAKRIHTAKIKSTIEKLAERRELFSNVLNPNFTLPKEAFFIRYTFQRKTWKDVSYSRKESERLTDVIRDILAKQKEVNSYEQILNDQYGKDWPKVVKMPRSAFLEQLSEEKKKLRYKNSVANKLLSALEELLAIDIFWNKQDKFPLGILRKDRNRAKARLTREMETTQQLLSQPNPSDNLFSSDEFSSEQLRNHLTPYFISRRALRLPESLKDYYKLWKDIYTKARDKTIKVNVETKDQIRLELRTVLPKILAQRVLLLQVALLTVDEKDQLLRQQRANQAEYAEASDLTKPLSEKARWSKNEAKSYIKEIKASKLPSLKGITLDELAKAAKEMTYFIDRYAADVLPNRIMNKEALEGWLNSKIDDINNLKSDMEPLRKLGYFKKMLSYLNNLLTPLPEENTTEGIGKNSFLRAWKRRVTLAYAICYRAQVLKKSQEASKQYDLITRDAFWESLRRELQSRERELNNLRSRNLENEFLEKMKTHNLVLEVQSS